MFEQQQNKLSNQKKGRKKSDENQNTTQAKIK